MSAELRNTYNLKKKLKHQFLKSFVIKKSIALICTFRKVIEKMLQIQDFYLFGDFKFSSIVTLSLCFVHCLLL